VIDDNPSVSVAIFIVANNVSNICNVNAGFENGSTFSLNALLSSLSLDGDFHAVTVCAIDTLCCVSNSFEYAIFVLAPQNKILRYYGYYL
jgi:hypothetical protein